MKSSRPPATVVIAHHNRPISLIGTLLRFSYLSRTRAEFVIIDNGSRRFYRAAAVFVGRLLTRHFKVILRENRGREAGAYWHYLRLTAEPSPVVLFIQDQIHRRGLTPSNVGRRNMSFNTREMPFYPGVLRFGSLDIIRVEKLLSINPNGLVGFGGKRCAHGVEADSRFLAPPFSCSTRALRLAYFDFFSGACFAVTDIGFNFLKAHEETGVQESETFYPHYWERLWGSLFVKAGFELVDYHSGETAVWHSVGTSKSSNGPHWLASVSMRLSPEFVRERLTSE